MSDSPGRAPTGTSHSSSAPLLWSPLSSAQLRPSRGEQPGTVSALEVAERASPVLPSTAGETARRARRPGDRRRSEPDLGEQEQRGAEAPARRAREEGAAAGVGGERNAATAAAVMRRPDGAGVPRF
jgi:hypothetical protein